jgi:hypothetical protein
VSDPVSPLPRRQCQNHNAPWAGRLCHRLCTHVRLGHWHLATVTVPLDRWSRSYSPGGQLILMSAKFREQLLKACLLRSKKDRQGRI